MNPDNWSSARTAVRGDYAAAQRAALALRRAANELDVLCHRRASLAAKARENWRGRYGREFDARLGQLDGEATGLIASLVAEAHRLDLAVEMAAEDQRSRGQLPPPRPTG